MNAMLSSLLILRLALLAAAAPPSLACAAAAAPYQWRDDQGRMVYSDLPPPASVAQKRIIRSVPPPAADVAAGSASGVAPGGPADPAPGGPAGAETGGVLGAGQTGADRELAYRKRAVERAAQEKKDAEESDRKLDLAKACSDAQGEIRSLLSGQRIGRISAAGEHEFLSDAERSERLKEARKNVGERC